MTEIGRGSGNVFKDLGLADSGELSTKVALAVQINNAIGGLTQARAAKLLGVQQPKISALRNYKLSNFSAERLMEFLRALDKDVKIVVSKKPTSRKEARITVQAE
jgi:predicted XRE-type DNA-binding protein